MIVVNWKFPNTHLTKRYLFEAVKACVLAAAYTYPRCATEEDFQKWCTLHDVKVVIKHILSYYFKTQKMMYRRKETLHVA